jgi:hypothetical protein
MRQPFVTALFVLSSLVSGHGLRGQSPAADSVTQVLRGLFDAMHSADTSRTRSVFLDGARIIPIATQSTDTTVGGLSVDAFVALVAKTATSPWIERMVNPDVRVSGGVALAWFEYDVHRGVAFSHCGVNAVTLRRTTVGWRIMTMAFTNAPQGSCTS